MILEPVLIRLFCNGIKPCICAQAKQKNRQKDIWDQGIKKTITVEAKAALNLPFLVREIDAPCPQNHCSASKPTKNHTRDQNSLSLRLQEARTTHPHCFERAETLERLHWDHQKSRHNRNCRNYDRHDSRPQGSIPATGVNTTKTPARNDRGQN